MNNVCGYEEAVRAGRRALDSLYRARRSLESARGWGMWDMLGGGMFSSMLKRSKMDDAQGWIEEAERDLRVFGGYMQGLNIDLNMGVLGFMDIFMDGFLADLFTQSKIARAREQLEDVIVRVENALAALERGL